MEHAPLDSYTSCLLRPDFLKTPKEFSVNKKYNSLIIR